MQRKNRKKYISHPNATICMFKNIVFCIENAHNDNCWAHIYPYKTILHMSDKITLKNVVFNFLHIHAKKAYT